MIENYAISRIENYKFSDIGGVFKDVLRILPRYDNPDINLEQSCNNVNLVDRDIKNIEKYILKYREEHNIKGRFNTVATNPKNLTNVACQCLFTASPEWINQFSREEQIKYFEDCLEFFKGEFPTAHIVAANVHFDQNTPHMHVTFLPTVERVNKKTGELETIFSTTLLMPGKEFFLQYQDRFYNFISSKYDGFTRGKSDRKNMSVKQFKEYKELEKQYKALSKECGEKINKNVIYFENGIKHELTTEEMFVLKALIKNTNELFFVASEEYTEAIKSLKALFEHLD